MLLLVLLVLCFSAAPVPATASYAPVDFFRHLAHSTQLMGFAATAGTFAAAALAPAAVATGLPAAPISVAAAGGATEVIVQTL